MHFMVSAERKLFAAFAFLNGVGYNSENGWFFSDLRRDVRLSLAARNARWRSELTRAELLEPFLRAGGAMLMDTLPFLSLAGEGPLASGDCLVGWQRQSRAILKDAGHWLERFCLEEKVDELWTKWLPSYQSAEQELEKIIPALEVIADKIDGEEDETAVTVTLLPNLLDARGRGYSVSTAAQTWLHFGPAGNASELEGRAIHELLHRWIDPAAERLTANRDNEALMRRARAEFRIVADSYPELPIWIGETVVRAATARLVPQVHTLEYKDEADMISFHERMGFIGFRDAYGFLESRSSESLKDNFSEALELVHHRIRDQDQEYIM